MTELKLTTTDKKIFAEIRPETDIRPFTHGVYLATADMDTSAPQLPIFRGKSEDECKRWIEQGGAQRWVTSWEVSDNRGDVAGRKRTGLWV